MKIGAVVCEYNPFHLGHLYQLSRAKEELSLDAVVGIMSGNFVQRGEGALFSKQTRAACALSNGMDLVLELPAVLTLQSAERYARNAVMTLHALGCVDTLFFGAECGDTEVLLSIAQVLAKEDARFSQLLKDALSDGVSFAAARAMAIEKLLGPASAEILNRPNNILGVEYCKALIRLNSPIKPYAMERKGADHHSELPKDGIASASYIRALSTKGEDFSSLVPENTLALIEKSPVFSMAAMEKSILASLCMQSASQLSRIADVSEGLEYALHRSALIADSLEDVILNVKSKRYAHSRIRRMVLNAYLGITQRDADLLPQYIRILDFNETGREVLHRAKETATLPLAKNGNQIKDLPEALTLWQRELSLDRVYQLFCTETKE